MNVLLIGNGGREHALAWKLADSSRVKRLFVAPGNAGTATLADNVQLDPSNFAEVEKFIARNAVDYVVIGPEEPLAAGLADAVAAMGRGVFGCSREAARLEADKWFAKELMRQQAIPTAEARSFTDPHTAAEYVRQHAGPLVVKAAGLAKGKGVRVCAGVEDALDAVEQAMRRRAFGEAGARVVIEEKLSGPECSILAFVDRSSLYIMESCQDHKPVGDGDSGPMTGGMGAYSPTPVMSEAILEQVERQILIPAIDGLKREGIDYRGVLYAGLMLTHAGPKVLEFNCRFGDPETQPLMMRMRSDLLEVMLAVTHDRLDRVTLKWDPRPAVCVVLASGGYPGDYEKGLPIEGIAEAEGMADVKVFHAGTRLSGGTPVTDGGRVLGVTALGQNFAEAQRRAYLAASKIRFKDMHYRRDIAHQAMK